MISHAQIPVVDQVSEEILRIYFSSRDNQGRSHPTYIEVEAVNPKNILYINDKPIIALGKLGTFDDNGIMPSWIVNHKHKKYLYYTAWNLGGTVSYRLAIGLAISEDRGKIFKKFTEGPIYDRNIEEPYWVAAPCIIKDGNIWKMWYISCTKWKIINDWPEPFYNVKYTESSDGIHWNKKGIVCIDYDDFTEAIARPYVFLEKGIYKMIYSYRNATNYRIDPKKSYRLGYAESANGIFWKRMDDKIGIEKSKNGWDSKMIEYGFMYNYNGKKYLFYNGNGFGKEGVGYAILKNEIK